MFREVFQLSWILVFKKYYNLYIRNQIKLLQEQIVNFPPLSFLHYDWVMSFYQ